MVGNNVSWGHQSFSGRVSEGPTMAPSVAHLHAWATHNSPPTSKRNRVEHSHNCAFLSARNTVWHCYSRTSSSSLQAPFFMPSCLCDEKAFFCCFSFYATCLNKRASRCKNTDAVQEFLVCLLSESEERQGPSAYGQVRRLHRGFGLSSLQREQRWQTNVRHVQRQAWCVHGDGRSPSGPCVYTTGGLQRLRIKRNWTHIKAFRGFLKWLIFPENTKERIWMGHIKTLSFFRGVLPAAVKNGNSKQY